MSFGHLDVFADKSKSAWLSVTDLGLEGEQPLGWHSGLSRKPGGLAVRAGDQLSVLSLHLLLF